LADAFSQDIKRGQAGFLGGNASAMAWLKNCKAYQPSASKQQKNVGAILSDFMQGLVSLN